MRDRPHVQRLEEHLASRDVVRVIYGAVVGLALVVALQDHPPTSGEAIAAVLGTAVAVGLAELYSELVGAEMQTRQPTHANRIREYAGDSVAVALGAGFPAVFFLLAAAGAMEMTTAFKLAKWTGVGLLCGYGLLAARLAGAAWPKALGQALVVGAIGAGLIAFKSLTH